MHRRAFRSALERTTRGVLPAGFAAGPRRPSPATTTAAAFFSSTSSQAVLKQVPGRQDRLAAAASEVSSLGGSNTDDSKTSRPSPFRRTADSDGDAPRSRPAGSNPHFSSGPSSDQGGSGGGGDNFSGSGIINVRSLPRGGAGFPGPSGVSSSSTGGRFPGGSNPAFQQGPGEGGRTGRFAGRFGPGSGGARGGPAKKKRFSRRKGGGNSRGAEERKKVEKEEEVTWTEEQLEWLYAHEMGAATAYEPALTLEGLLGHGPAVASAADASSVGNVAAALRAMRVVAGGEPFGGGQEDGASALTAVHNPEGARARLEKGETVFFDTAGERALVEAALRSKRGEKKLKALGLPAGASPIAPVSASVKEAILETAVRGLYDGPSAAADPEQPGTVFETLHRYRAQGYTYSAEHGRSFDKKVRELLPQGGKAAKGGRQARA